MPRRGKGCTRQSADLTPHRYPERQSTACAILLLTIGHTFGVRVDGPTARRFLSLTAFQAEGCGIALMGDEHKVSVTGFTFSAIWHDKHSAELSAFGRYTPLSGCAGLPPKGETTHYDLCVAGASSNHVRCASTGKRVTRFSGRFASLRIVFPCHPCSGGRIKHLEASLRMLLQ